jgi:hypothetical protein
MRTKVISALSRISGNACGRRIMYRRLAKRKGGGRHRVIEWPVHLDLTDPGGTGPPITSAHFTGDTRSPTFSINLSRKIPKCQLTASLRLARALPRRIVCEAAGTRPDDPITQQGTGIGRTGLVR